MAQEDLRNVARARARITKAEDLLDRAMLRAHESGESFRDIGKVAGMSHQKVSDRLEALRKRDREKGAWPAPGSADRPQPKR
jgi:DNA-directed RNA polymerase specialized sigma24 family protein